MSIIETFDRTKILEMGKVKYKTLLDIGVGSLATIAAKNFYCNVTSIDINMGALKKAKEEALGEGLTEKIKFELEDATNLSYPSNKFDIAISYCALHHVLLKKRREFIYELYRVSKEKIIIAEFNEYGFPHTKNEYNIVDLNWLEKKLKDLGKTEKYLGKNMNVYICFKSDKN